MPSSAPFAFPLKSSTPRTDIFTMTEDRRLEDDRRKAAQGLQLALEIDRREQDRRRRMEYLAGDDPHEIPDELLFGPSEGARGARRPSTP